MIASLFIITSTALHLNDDDFASLSRLSAIYPLRTIPCLPTGTQRPIKPTHTIHVLPILRFLLLPHPIHIIPRHLCILRALELHKPHCVAHGASFGARVYVHCIVIIGAWLIILLWGNFVFLRWRWGLRGGGAVGCGSSFGPRGRGL